VLPWLEQHHDDPFFLWVHYFDPHHPHEPPPPYNQLFVHDLYAGEIAYADESLGTLLEHLKRLGVYDHTLIVFTADHGEGNGEHNESTHSLLMYNSTLHVPLIVKFPNGDHAGRRVSPWVGLVDVFPTVLELLDMETPDAIQGTSLMSHLRSDKPATSELYAETLSPRLSRDWGELRGLISGDYKYIHGPRPELYNLMSDPKELDNLIDRHPDVAADLRERLQDYLDEHAVPDLDSSVYVDEETLRRLQGLGYVQTSGTPVGYIEETLRSDGKPPQDHVATISAYSLAKNLVFSGRLPEAKRIINALRKNDSDNAAYLELLVQIEIKLGQHDAALAVLEAMPLTSSGTLPAQKILELMGNILAAQGKLSEAADKYRDAQVVEETAAGQHRLAQFYLQLGQPEKQLNHLRKALQLDPRFVPARLDLAVHHAQHNESEQAEAEFNRALQDHPYWERTVYNYGTFLAHTDRSEQALGYFRRALELRPGYRKAHYALIETLVRLGQQDQAQQQLALLVAQAADSPEAALARTLFAQP
jgi:Tfp pilus assembly protein PilF